MIQEESKMLCVFRCSLTNSGIRVTLGNVVFYQMFFIPENKRMHDF